MTVATAPPDVLDTLLAEHAVWLAVERGLRPNTLAAYQRDLHGYRAFLRARGLDTPARVDERVVRAYLEHLQALCNDDGTSRYSSASVARALVSVRSFHRFCAEDGALVTDPALEVRAPRVPRGIPKALTEAEVLSLLGAVTGDEPRALRDRAILETLYASGIRIGELVGLDRADVDLGAGLLRVVGKGDRERVVPIGRAAREALDAYLVRGRPALLGDGARRRNAADAVFLNARGTRLTRQGGWGIVRTAAGRVGLAARVFPHVLRHSCATHLLDHGADIRIVQELLGHASVSTTQIYTLVSPERLRATFQAAHPRAGESRPGTTIG
jgi:integrase/recombinase XerD